MVSQATLRSGRTSLRLYFADGSPQLLGPFEAVDLDEVVATEDLLRLGERPVGHDRLAASYTDGGGCLDALQRLARHHLARADDALGELEPLAHVGLLGFVAVELRDAGLAVDQQHVLHRFLL